MQYCPRCLQKITRPEPRCVLCGLVFKGSFDRTSGHPEGKRYLDRIIGGHFKTLSILAGGGHGLVLLVRHTKLHRRNIFALKLLKPELSQNESFRKRFLREAEIVYSFSHPNIVPIREFGETDEGEFYFTMDFCRGQPLDRAMRSGKPFHFRRVLKIADDVLQGLSFAHHHQIVHRDLKPGNIFLEENGRDGETAKILDFGIAKPNGRGAVELTCVKKVLGTPHYMAPEQILGKKVDGRADLYALGVVLYRIFAGKPPFEGRTGHEVLTKHLRDTPVPLRKIHHELPVEISHIVQRLLSKNLEERPASADALREELKEFRNNAGREGEQSGRKSRNRMSRAAVYLLVLGLLTIGGFLFLAGSFFESEKESEATGPAHSQQMPAEEDSTKGEGTRENDPRGSGTQKEEGIEGDGTQEEGVKTGKREEKRMKWCRFCRKTYSADKVQCPDCGQFLFNKLRPDAHRFRGKAPRKKDLRKRALRKRALRNRIPPGRIRRRFPGMIPKKNIPGRHPPPLR